jgi:molybdopterin molybdotransferase
VDLGISADRRDDLEQAIDAATGLDALVISGGASVGDYDLVQPILRERGLELDFWKIAMRPGKPMIFGHLGPMPVIGFPGNPVSTAVCAIVFLRGALLRCLGQDPALPLAQATLATALPTNDQRQDYMRATLERSPGGQDLVRPAAIQDSSMSALMANADALVVRPPHAPAAAAGELATILPLREIYHCMT